MLHFKSKDHIINKKQIAYNQDKVQSWVQSSPSDLKSCDFCSQSFESLNDLADHMVEDHQDGDGDHGDQVDHPKVQDADKPEGSNQNDEHSGKYLKDKWYQGISWIFGKREKSGVRVHIFHKIDNQLVTIFCPIIFGKT